MDQQSSRRLQGVDARVAIGPVFDEFGGVSAHIHSIAKHSRYEIKEIPSPGLRRVLRYSDLMFNHLQLTPKDVYQEARSRVGLNGFDILHSHAHAWFTRLCRAGRAKSKAWIHTYHTLYHFEEDNPSGLTSAQIEANSTLLDVAPEADVCIAVSNWLHDYLEGKYSIRTVVIPNGVDISDCRSADASRFYRSFGMRDFVLFVGSTLPSKNPIEFIELARTMPDLRFVMIGRNLSEDQVARSLDTAIPDNIVLLGECSHERTLDAIAASRILVMTSRREGLPTTLLEAMALSKPVVAPNHTGCREVIQSERFGFLYNPNSLEDLAEKTRHALDSKEVGVNAREMVLERYDWRLLAPMIDDLYGKFL